MLDVTLPWQMAHLPKDHRGYPIPVNAYVDKKGKAHFTINDEEKRQERFRKKQCHICGLPLTKLLCVVGGPGSAFDPKGAYIDGPMHAACCEYAMQVCPYLAAPHYGKRIDDKLLKPDDSDKTLFTDPTMMALRPPLFVVVRARGYTSTPFHGTKNTVQYIKPKRPYLSIGYWRNGERLLNTEGLEMALTYMKELQNRNIKTV